MGTRQFPITQPEVFHILPMSHKYRKFNLRTNSFSFDIGEKDRMFVLKMNFLYHKTNNQETQPAQTPIPPQTSINQTILT